MSTLTDYLTGIADALREKKGTISKIPAQNFASEIGNLELSNELLVDYTSSADSSTITLSNLNLPFDNEIYAIECVGLADGYYIGLQINGATPAGQQVYISNTSYNTATSSISGGTLPTAAVIRYTTQKNCALLYKPNPDDRTHIGLMAYQSTNNGVNCAVFKQGAFDIISNLTFHPGRSTSNNGYKISAGMRIKIFKVGVHAYTL